VGSRCVRRVSRHPVPCVRLPHLESPEHSWARLPCVLVCGFFLPARGPFLLTRLGIFYFYFFQFTCFIYIAGRQHLDHQCSSVFASRSFRFSFLLFCLCARVCLRVKYVKVPSGWPICLLGFPPVQVFTFTAFPVNFLSLQGICSGLGVSALSFSAFASALSFWFFATALQSFTIYHDWGAFLRQPDGLSTRGTV